VAVSGCDSVACLYPNTAYYSDSVNPTGKRSLVFNKLRSFSGVPIQVPCGQCIECRLNYARGWSIRLMKESQCHEVSSFLTLTYDEDHLPEGGSLVREHISAFCKRLHNRLLRSRGYGIRFYYAGEYGEHYGRPHYHTIIFGFNFPDRKFYKYNKRGEPIFQSEYCRELWPFGRNGIGEVTPESCSYVAGYVVDKVNGKKEQEGYYVRTSADGVVYSLLPEFAGMSRRPGIGRLWFERFAKETYRDDFTIMNGMKVRPPRYFDVLFDAVDSKRLKRVKLVRRRKALDRPKRSNRRSIVRETVLRAKLRVKGKDLI